MKKDEYREAENMIHHLHDGQDLPNFDEKVKASKEYTDIEKIYRVREQVAFLGSLNPGNRLWAKVYSHVGRKSAYQVWLKYAALIIISFSLGSLLIYLIGINPYNSSMATINCPSGQITSLTLFDGTTVWLNSGSSLKYRSDFNASGREVFVEGEAFFDVAHNKNKPFIVNLENSRIKVHGTKFNVKAYPGSGQVEAVLLEGKITFSTSNESVDLKPSERIVISDRHRRIEKDWVDAEKVAAWKEGRYFYDNEKLTKIIEQMQRWYDVEFVFDANSLESYQFTGIINRDKTILYNIKLLELTNKIDVKYRNDKIYIEVKK
ncbi:FecR family protein [Sunxiuqinia sp. sy24]|uniref:FecR family protein n=1 Tax=Sunxiuqinia sp. sy24 TaxID=3461495 RepID=UPI0040458113